MGELDGVIALLLLLAVAIVWLAVEVRRVHDAVAPLAESGLAAAIART